MSTRILALIFLLLPAMGAQALVPPRPLSGDEIWTLLAGHDVYGTYTEDGSRWAERTTRDGRVLNLMRGSRLVGRWAVDGDKACYIYHGAEPHHVCYRILDIRPNYAFEEVETGRTVATTTRITKGK